MLEKYILVTAATEFSGYESRYLRRLLRTGGLEGVKIDRISLIKMTSPDGQAHKKRGAVYRCKRAS